jgi:hypothetical protein
MLDAGAWIVAAAIVLPLAGMAYRSWKANRNYQDNPKNRGSYPS